MTHSGDYAYTSLSGDRSIRLLQIHPDAAAQKGFSVKFRTHELDSCPSFCTLSYTARTAKVPGEADKEDGSADDKTVRIDCEGQTLLVTEKLFNFLCHARDEGWFTEDEPSKDPSTPARLGDERVAKSRYVWIDAISINQKDLDERSSQVSLMGQIYRRASTVLVWFGKENPSPGAERVLQTFMPAFVTAKRGNRFKELRGKDPWCNDAIAEELLGKDACAVWRQDWVDLFLFLVQCRWILRGWVVQEVVLRSMDDRDAIIIVCGSLRIHWADLSEFLSALTTLDWRQSLTRRLRDHPTAGKYDFAFSVVLQRVQAVWNVRSHEIKGCFAGRNPSWLLQEFGGELSHNERAFSLLFKIMHALRSQEFTDRRDYVYGILGLLEAVMPPGAQEIVHPDYGLSDVDVISRTSWSILSNMPYLDILSAVQNSAATFQTQATGTGPPSWVPNFTARFIGASFLSVRRSFGNIQFDASRSRSPCSKFRLEDGRGLTLIGNRVCHIDSSVGLTVNEMHLINWVKVLEDLGKHGKGDYPGRGESYDEALCRTLVANTFLSTVAKDNQQPEVRKWCASALAISLRHLKASDKDVPNYDLLLAGDGGNEKRWLPSASDVVERSEHVKNEKVPRGPIQTVVHRLWPRRCIFSTDDGRLGLGPQFMQKTDEVWVLQGGRTPFILRKRKEGGHIFVGDAYLHGAMHGELATPDFKNGMGEVTIF